MSKGGKYVPECSFGLPTSVFGTHTFVQQFQPELVDDTFGQMGEMEIRSKKGRVAHAWIIQKCVSD